MTMLEIYKSRKDALTQRIRESKSLYETGSVISETFETMQYQYLSQGDNDLLTDKLTQVMDMAKASFPLLESVSKYKLWENSDDVNSRKKKSPLPGFIFLLVGLALVFGSAGYYMFLHNLKIADVQQFLAAAGAGCLVILISGFMLFHRRKQKSKQTVEISADAQDLTARIEEIVKCIDVMMETEKKNIAQQKALMDTAINADEVQLFSYLMEAKFSGQPDYAYEQLDEVRHYLAKQDILTVTYTKGNEKYFEFLDGDETKTIRPALLRNGQVLALGLVQLKTE